MLENFSTQNLATCYTRDTIAVMNFARVVKDLRETLFLSQTELAKKLGVSYATVNRWENGHHEPTFKDRRKIVALCKKHNIPMVDGE